MFIIGNALVALVRILDTILFLYMLLIIIAAILSWVNPDPRNAIVRIIRNLTEPALDRVRPFVPLIGGIDLTPILVIFVIYFIRIGILPSVMTLAQMML